MNKTLIPENIAGKKVDLKAVVTPATAENALNTFHLAGERLLRPDIWHNLCGKASAIFELMGDGQKPVIRPAIQGDYIRINIPGPGPTAGEGYDWVRVALIEYDADNSKGIKYIGIKLVPCSSPVKDDAATAHFFKQGSSSTLIIRLENTTVTSTYHGRNETINNDTDNLADDIRNTAMGLGAMAGLSELQWSTLIHAFLENKDE